MSGARPAARASAPLATGTARTMATTSPVHRSVLFLELNEAEKYFIDKFVGEGKLPVFARLLRDGVLHRDRIPDFDADDGPGLAHDHALDHLAVDLHGPDAGGARHHRLRPGHVADPGAMRVGRAGRARRLDRRVRQLDEFPPRNAGAASYYVPESLADDAGLLPRGSAAGAGILRVHRAQLQRELLWQAARRTRLLLSSMRSGVARGTVMRTLMQMPSEVLLGDARVPERAMLQSYILTDAFKTLYAPHRPAFATLHLNHVAYMQHRYWRAAEPERFRDELSLTDQRFFKTSAERKRYEKRFALDRDELRSATDRCWASCSSWSTTRRSCSSAPALGQRPHDPVHEIHNPVVRLVNERELFDRARMRDVEVLHQMNPDVSVNLRRRSRRARARRGASSAGLYVHAGKPLFEVERRGRQVFLELIMPVSAQRREVPADPAHRAPGFRCRSRATSTSTPPTTSPPRTTRSRAGCSPTPKGLRSGRARHDSIFVTEIAPTILSWFGIAPQPWMTSPGTPAIHVH